MIIFETQGGKKLIRHSQVVRFFFQNIKHAKKNY